MKIKINIQNNEDKNYDIFIDELSNLSFDTKVAIITNPKVSGLHLGFLLQKIKAKELYIITILDGEHYKNQKSIDFILQNLFNHRFDRKSLLIAFGGGVIGDMCGYCASIYQRGINFIQIPTTLLSQVDASVGGKTGINNEFGKNLIGVFYQPKAVYCEHLFLKTLPKKEFSAGIAEIIKMAACFDEEFFVFLENHDLYDEKNLKIAIAKSIQTKAKVVDMDEKETGKRAILNYGHTFAHVIENETKYTKYLHGQAVSIGIMMANKLSVKLNLINENIEKRFEKLFLKYDLPISYKIKDENLFYEAFFLDKKSENDVLKFIILEKLGSGIIKKDISKDIILQTLKEYS